MEYKRLTEKKIDLEKLSNKAKSKISDTYLDYAKMNNALWELENKIENGTMIELPCKVGTTIYHLYKAGDVITEDKVFNYHFEICSKPCVSFENYYWYGTYKRVDTILVEQFGKWWFLTKTEAEKRLEELQNGRSD